MVFVWPPEGNITLYKDNINIISALTAPLQQTDHLHISRHEATLTWIAAQSNKLKLKLTRWDPLCRGQYFAFENKSSSPRHCWEKNWDNIHLLVNQVNIHELFTAFRMLFIYHLRERERERLLLYLCTVPGGTMLKKKEKHNISHNTIK